MAQVDWLFADSLLKQVERVASGARETIATVMAEARSGHLCVQVEDLSALPEEIVAQVDNESGFPTKPLCQFGDLLYLQKNWIFESRVLKHIERLKGAASLKGNNLEWSDLNVEQREAASQALGKGVSLITGGPGTGKTYTAARIIAALQQGGECHIAVAAPTGKAASALEVALLSIMPLPVAMTVGTVHTLLGLRPNSEFSERSLPYDLLIVDECSMIDAPLFASLLASVDVQTRLVLMGDPDQLPPVETGSLFADIIALDLFPCTRLVRCMRSERASILQLAKAIRDGKSSDAINHIDTCGLKLDLGFATKRIDTIYEKVWNEVRGRYSVHTKEKPSAGQLMHDLTRFRILSCLRSGPLGVDALNQMIVQRFYIEAQEGEYVAIPILLTRRDAELNLFNGQMGILLKQKRNGVLESEEVVFPGRVLSASLVQHLEVAFCLSVHKAQGSEYDDVLLLVPSGSENFGREVLYTAVTRAKHQLFIDGDVAIINQAIETSSLKRSGLRQRMRASPHFSRML